MSTVAACACNNATNVHQVLRQGQLLQYEDSAAKRVAVYFGLPELRYISDVLPTLPSFSQGGWSPLNKLTAVLVRLSYRLRAESLIRKRNTNIYIATKGCSANE